jgi:hypothetical protein
VDLADEVTSAGWGETLSLDVSVWAKRFAELSGARPEPPGRDARRAWVAERYSWSNLAETLEQHYRRLTGRVAAPHSSPKVRAR